ncbi:MAG: hypothetical protein ACTSQF_04950 [Candidatus Heimdallarchaeaceae archaeon]
MKSKGSIIALLVLLLSINVLSVSSDIPVEVSPNSTLTSSYLTVGDFNWTESAFIPHYETGYAESTTEDFSSNVTSSEIHVYETSSSYYHLYAGVYALVPTFEDSLVISFEGRASSDRYDQIIMGVAVIDPSDMKYFAVNRTYDYQDSGISSSHDTGYQTFDYNYNTTGYTEVLLFFFYVDATVAFWDQNIWVDYLRVYTDSVPPEPEPEPESSEFLKIGDFTWIEDAFIPHYETGYATPTSETFGSTITENTINVYELPNNDYHLYAGVYALVPVVNNTLSFSFQGRASANYKECVIMGVATIDPSDMKYLNVSRPYDLQSQYDPNYFDTGYNPFEYNFTLQGYTEVYLYFFYVDATSAFWDQNIWVDDLKIDTLIDLPIADDPPIISGLEAIAIETDTTNNYITWTLTDDNPSFYKVYSDDDLLEAENWESPATILVNIDFLETGIHNLTIIAYDSNGNYAVDTVVVVVTDSTQTNIISFTFPIVCLISLAFVVFRKRK